MHAMPDKSSVFADVTLTPRQTQVLTEIATGGTEVEIASRLGIAPRIVRMHADALRAKFQVRRRRELIALYRELVDVRTDLPALRPGAEH